MKKCSLCHVLFDDREESSDNPPSVLGELFLRTLKDVSINDICPKCKEESGILAMLGLDL